MNDSLEIWKREPCCLELLLLLVFFSLLLWILFAFSENFGELLIGPLKTPYIPEDVLLERSKVTKIKPLGKWFVRMTVWNNCLLFSSSKIENVLAKSRNFSVSLSAKGITGKSDVTAKQRWQTWTYFYDLFVETTHKVTLMTISTFCWLFSAKELTAKFYSREFTDNGQSIMRKNQVRSEKSASRFVGEWSGVKIMRRK